MHACVCACVCMCEQVSWNRENRLYKGVRDEVGGDKYLIVQRFITFLLSNILNNNTVTTVSSSFLSGSVLLWCWVLLYTLRITSNQHILGCFLVLFNGEERNSLPTLIPFNFSLFSIPDFI